MSSDETIRKAARALWDYDNDDQTPEWREMAWNDMGGPEPSHERVDYEIRAEYLAQFGLLAPAPLREEWGIRNERGGRELIDKRRDRAHAESGVGNGWHVAHRYITNWLPADHAEGDGEADQ